MDPFIAYVCHVEPDGKTFLHLHGETASDFSFLIPLLLKAQREGLTSEQIASILHKPDCSGCTVLHACAKRDGRVDGNPSQFLVNLIEYGEKFFPPDEMGQWLLRVDYQGECFLQQVAENHRDGQRLLELLDYGEKYPYKEGITQWLSSRDESDRNFAENFFDNNRQPNSARRRTG